MASPSPWRGAPLTIPPALHVRPLPHADRRRPQPPRGRPGRRCSSGARRHPTTHSPVIPFTGATGTGKTAAATASGWTRPTTASTRTAQGAAALRNATTTLPLTWRNSGARPGSAASSLGSAATLIRPSQGPGRMYFVLAAQRPGGPGSHDPQLQPARDRHSSSPTARAASSSPAHTQAFLREDGQPHRRHLVLTHRPRPRAHLPQHPQRRRQTAPDSSAMRRQALYAGLRRPRRSADRPRPAGHPHQHRPGRGCPAHAHGWNADELAHMKRSGLHTSPGEVGRDRDNRGKVYLYFCPEDMTVALRSVRDIGWQGRARPARSHPALRARRPILPPRCPCGQRKPLQELGPRCSGCS